MASGNPNLTSGQMLPGFYGYVDYNISGAPQPANLRVLLWGYMGAAGTQPPNLPFRPVDGTDASQRLGGTNTDAWRAYNACVSQPESQGSDVWIMPIQAPSGGTAATYQITVFVSNTNPVKSGTIQLWVASQPVPAVGFTTADTNATIATAVAAALLATPNAPIATAAVATNVITVTYPHKGTTGEDFPVRCNLLPAASGVNLSPGQALFATSAVGAGSVVVNVGAVTVTTALSGAETAAQIATKVVASFAANSYPVTAVVDGTVPAQVDFYYNNNYDVRRMSAAVVTTTGTTVNLGGGATSGTGSASSLTYNGTQGVGAPSLTNAIGNLQTSQKWYRSWSMPWTDATTLGAIATYIEAGSNGSITGQKLQVLTVCDWQALTVDGAIPPAVSPNLTATPPHYAFGWSPDCSVQAFELAARVAGARASKWLTAPQFNWNGFKLQGNQSAPILAPANVPSLDVLNSALRTYALSPWVIGASGNIEVVKGRTTSLAADLRLWAWSAEAQAAYHIQDLLTFYPSIFGGGNIVRYSDPKAPKIFDTQSFIDVTRDRLGLWEKQGNYDGAKLLGPQVTSSIDQVNINRGNVEFPESPVLDLDQIVFTSHFTQPSA
jgi:phage tail sheath gpL-like